VVLDRNRYSVPAAFVGRAVSVRSTATQASIVADGTMIAQHARRFGRDQLICDPWHYLPILERKSGALRNGTPFCKWDLPQSIQLVRDRILKQPKGDRAFVELLLMARDAGSAEPEPAKPTWPRPWEWLQSTRANASASTTPATWSTNSNRKSSRAKRATWPDNWSRPTPSSSMNWATCHSSPLAAPCCSI